MALRERVEGMEEEKEEEAEGEEAKWKNRKRIW